MYILYLVSFARVHSCIISHIFRAMIWMMKLAERDWHLGTWYLTFQLINNLLTPPNTRLTNEVSDINKGYIFGTEPWNICDYQIGCQLCDI